MRRIDYHNKGIALFISMLILLLLSILTTVILLRAYNYSYVTEKQLKRIRALTIAEAGINYAYHKIRINDAAFIGAASSAAGSTITPDPAGPSVTIKITSGPAPLYWTINSAVDY